MAKSTTVSKIEHRRSLSYVDAVRTRGYTVKNDGTIIAGANTLLGRIHGDKVELYYLVDQLTQVEWALSLRKELLERDIPVQDTTSLPNLRSYFDYIQRAAFQIVGQISDMQATELAKRELRRKRRAFA